MSRKKSLKIEPQRKEEMTVGKANCGEQGKVSNDDQQDRETIRERIRMREKVSLRSNMNLDLKFERERRMELPREVDDERKKKAPRVNTWQMVERLTHVRIFKHYQK